MANKNSLKEHFQTGDTPSQIQYADLIDSNLNLSDTAIQQVSSDIYSYKTINFIDMNSNGITYVDNNGSVRFGLQFSRAQNLVSLSNRASNGFVQIRANGASSGEGGEVTSSIFTSYSNEFLQHVTASGNIIANGSVTAGAFYGDGSGLTNAPSTFTNITASGNISASGALIGNSLTLGGTAVNASATEINYLDGVLSTVKNAYDTAANVSQGVIRFTELDNGTDDLSLTGLLPTSGPTFAGLTLTKQDYGELDVNNATQKSIGGPAGKLIVRNVPSIAAGENSPTYSLTTGVILNTSVIIISTSALITCNATNIADGSCKITFHNPTQTNFSNAHVTINIVIL